jgi:hypothetical protein
VQGLGFRVQGLGFRVQGLGFRVQGLGFRVQGLRCMAHCVERKSEVVVSSPKCGVSFVFESHDGVCWI